MTNADLEAVNTLKNPKAVTPAKGKGAKVKDGLLTATLPPYSYQMLRLKSGGAMTHGKSATGQGGFEPRWQKSNPAGFRAASLACQFGLSLRARANGALGRDPIHVRHDPLGL